jgi:hypothetical protein
MSQLQQIDQILKIDESIKKTDQKIALIEAKQEGYKEGFKAAQQIYCQHLSTMDMGDEDHVSMVCTDCGKESGSEDL